MDTSAITSRSDDLGRQAASLEIRSQGDADTAGRLLLAAKEILGRIDEAFDPAIKAAYEAHRSLISSKRRHADPVHAVEARLKAMLAAWDRARREQAMAEQARMAEEARRREEERRLAEAELLAAQGRADEAEAVLERPVDAPVVRIVDARPSVDGVSVRKVWRWSLEDITRVPIEYLRVDAEKVTAVVRGLRGQTNIPGIRVYEDAVVVARHR